ncbi:MAG: hypothetical protein U1E93_09090 [Alphaproteobacteria bacterium]
MTIAVNDAEFVDPHTAMLFQLLAHDFAANLGADLREDLPERGRVTPLYGGSGSVLVDLAFEIVGQMVGNGRTGPRSGWQGHQYQE